MISLPSRLLLAMLVAILTFYVAAAHAPMLVAFAVAWVMLLVTVTIAGMKLR